MKRKIVSLKKAVGFVESNRKKGKKIVLCHGLFDLLHVGHIRYLKSATNYGDIVIVSILADKCIDGIENIQFNEKFRAEAIASFDWIDAVVINPEKDILEFLKLIKPDVLLEGSESNKSSEQNKIERGNRLKFLRKIGIESVIVKEDNFASTGQINRYLTQLPDNVHRYIQLFKQRYSTDNIFDIIHKMKDLRVLVIGDAILDEYQYCSTIGKSSKDPTLALRYESHDLFAGGVLAVANHAASFSDHVDMITILGENDSHETFIRSKLKENIRPTFLFKPNAPTLIKRRFIDGYSMNKLIEIYIMDDSFLDGEIENDMYESVRSRLPEYDLVLAADFGHGAINSRLKELLSHEAPFLAVNAQSNAGNRGFNNITKYSRTDYASMAEHEIRLEMRDMNGSIRQMMKTLNEKLQCHKITVTRGRKGCMIHGSDGSFVQVPSFAYQVVDRVGAGDALFALTSLAAIQNVSSELIGFIGNVGGAIAVGIMGNLKFVDRDAVTEFITNLLE